jgi:hypothetical protein
MDGWMMDNMVPKQIPKNNTARIPLRHCTRYTNKDSEIQTVMIASMGVYRPIW